MGVRADVNQLVILVTVYVQVRIIEAILTAGFNKFIIVLQVGTRNFVNAFIKIQPVTVQGIKKEHANIISLESAFIRLGFILVAESINKILYIIIRVINKGGRKHMQVDV